MIKNKLILNKKEILKILGNEYKGLTDIFSDKFGIVNAMLERHELNKYDLYMYQCLSANTIDLFNVSREVSSGGLGVNENKKIAMTSCLAEALESYGMSYIPKKNSKKSELKKITEYSTIPVIVIGGINKNTIPTLKEIKIDGYAMIRPILKEENITEATKYLKTIINKNGC